MVSDAFNRQSEMDAGCSGDAREAKEDSHSHMGLAHLRAMDD